MRLGVLGSNNIYVRETTEDFSKDFHIDLVLLRKSSDLCSIDDDKNINLISLNKFSTLDLLSLPLVLRKVQENVDGFLIHYLNPYFAALISLGIFKKPIIYFCYGGDIHKQGLRKWLVKRALGKINFTFVEMENDRKLLCNEFNVEEKKVIAIIWYPVHFSFHPVDNKKINEFKKKWCLDKKYIIFSPRTLTEFYNHHLLIQGVSLLEEKLKNDIQIVVVGQGEKMYLRKLEKMANELNVNLINIKKFLSPDEMAELYSISLATCNIPQNDGIGRCIIEGGLCGSISLLNKRVVNYGAFFEDGMNCFFIADTGKSIAEGIKRIINLDKNEKEVIRSNFKKSVFDTHFDWKINKKIIINKIEEMVINVPK